MEVWGALWYNKVFPLAGEKCPVIENKDFILRLVEAAGAPGHRVQAMVLPSRVFRAMGGGG